MIRQFPKNGRLFTPKCRLDHTRAPKPISQRGLQARWARANPLLQPLPTAAVRGSRRLMVMWGWGEKTSRASRSLGHICFDMCVRECARVVCICAVYVCVCASVYACMCDCVCVCVCVCLSPCCDVSLPCGGTCTRMHTQTHGASALLSM